MHFKKLEKRDLNKYYLQDADVEIKHMWQLYEKDIHLYHFYVQQKSDVMQLKRNKVHPLCYNLSATYRNVDKKQSQGI